MSEVAGMPTLSCWEYSGRLPARLHTNSTAWAFEQATLDVLVVCLLPHATGVHQLHAVSPRLQMELVLLASINTSLPSCCPP
jgi:hypothetical protein